MTCEEDKLISEVLGEAPAAEDCPDAESEESTSGSAPFDIESVTVSSRQL